VWGSGSIAPPFLTSSLDGGEWSASHPSRFIAGEEVPTTHWIGCWVGPRAGLALWRGEKPLAPAGNQSPAVQSAARRYTA
jgi:hypothetical protein